MVFFNLYNKSLNHQNVKRCKNIDENYMNNLESLESFEPFIHVTHAFRYDYYDIKTVLYTCEDK